MGVRMRPKERRDSGQADLFRTRLNQTIDVKHPLVKLVAAIGWPGLETHFGAGQTAFFTGDSRGAHPSASGVRGAAPR